MTLEECAEIVKESGKDYFMYKSLQTCKVCELVADAVFDVTTYPASTGAASTIYMTRPNYPLQLQDPANNQQCAITCDPKLPWDAALSGTVKCMAPASTVKLQCHSN